MKLTVQQKREIKEIVAASAINENAFNEMYDHILSDLEQRPEAVQPERDKIQQMVFSEFSEMVNTDAEVKNYHRLNNILGLIMFAAALCIYWCTMEPTVSFWDCGEFISASWKMEVGHQPGAPLFLMLSKVFGLMSLGNAARIAYWTNFGASVSSAAAIMFLFWTITLIGRKIMGGQKLKRVAPAIFAAGIIGSLSFAVSDTFWFSAVESEVYALSVLFTAVTFWLILKWERSGSDRYLVLIAYLTGLSIGVHLLSLLTIPSLSLVVYYSKTKKVSVGGILKAFISGCILVALVQFGIIQYLVLAAAKTDLLFVNTFGLPFCSGAVAFVLLAGIAIAWGIRYAVRIRHYYLHLGLICLSFLLLGFSSYFMIIIRANAKPAINLSNPDTPFSLYSYLSRSNYLEAPLFYGNTFDARVTGENTGANTYRRGEKKYEVSGQISRPEYDRNMLFPRIYSQRQGHADYYRNWLGLGEEESPSFSDNIKFFTSWQMGFMYWRYFFWNFAGRQNDLQGFGSPVEGNWITGIKPLDSVRLGNQWALPPSVTANAAYNRFFAFPLILGLAGLFWLYRRDKNKALTLLCLFFFTGLAIILYLNQDPLQPRERDYAYVGSFYVFAIFIGFGVLLVRDLLVKIVPRIPSQAGLFGAFLICLAAVPFLMGSQGWNDHDRSGKYTARDWARNYLNSCAPNAILFTNADNDTYPLWYIQEVEKFRTDVRVVCIQFLSDDSYIDALKKQLNKSAPLPISMRHDQYADGVRDYMPYVDYKIQDSVELKDILSVLTSPNQNDMVEMSDGSYANFLPTRKFKMSVDKDQLIRTHTVSANEKASLTSSMEWNFDKQYATKADMAMFDILVTNNWKRPVYFATSVSSDTYLGLDDYLYLEGYAYRLIPFNKAADGKDKSQRTHSDVMYSNVINKFDYGSFKQTHCLDPESRRIALTSWDFNNNLVANLINEGKPVKAARVMKKSLKDLPEKNYTIQDTLARLATIQNLYALNQTSQANNEAQETCKFITGELNYISIQPEEKRRSFISDIRLGLYVMNTMSKLAAAYSQQAVSTGIKKEMDSLGLLM